MAEKRKEQEDSDDEIGPMPMQPQQAKKKKKVLEFESIYLDDLPSATQYEISFMHRDILSFVTVTSSDFLVTVSVDGHLKFWKKQKKGLEFVKHFRSHLDVVQCIDASRDGSLLATVGKDKACKVFDVVNFDMINMIKLDYVPKACAWIYKRGQAQAFLAISVVGSSDIHIYDGRSPGAPLKTINIHNFPVIAMKYNEKYDVVVSADEKGLIEYWTPESYEFPKNVAFELKSDTDLFEFAKNKTIPNHITFSKDEEMFVCMGQDRQIRIFKFRTGKMYRKYDESLQVLSEMQQARTAFVVLDDIEFNRRLAIERELEKSDMKSCANAVFDESGNFILYGSPLGVKVVNIVTNKVARMLGKAESNQRFLNVSLYQGVPKAKATITLEMAASENPAFKDPLETDPMLFATAFKKNRFYAISKREPEEQEDTDGQGRDVFNEKPTREEQTVAITTKSNALGSIAVIHTTMGDITIKLFPEFAPLAVENFVTHSRNSYYNDHLFHRVIKGFMIQTGDPKGDGTGGESIWGHDFSDEFHRNLRHDRPYTVSMANAGPGTNGSQFFVTVNATPWLDNKHTIFGRCISGLDTVHKIEQVKADKQDKPIDDVKIINIDIK